jgi:Flp pilus assembly pilin Flp
MLNFFVAAQNAIFALKNREEGQTMAEYGVVLAVITIGAILALGFLSDSIVSALDRVKDTLTGAGTESGS